MSEPAARDFDFLKSLEAFVGVAESGSMTVAASQLGITQSAISQQIKLLEAHFGAPLFHRDIRPLRLTPAGQLLQNRATSVLLAAREMRDEVRHVAAGRLPHLRIAILSTFAQYLVPAILYATMTRSLIAQNVAVIRGLSINHAQDLINREIDVAFTSDALEDASAFDHLELLQESYVIATPKGVVAKVDDLKALIKAHPFLGYSGRTQSGQRIERHLRRLRLEIPRGNSFESSSDLVRAIARGYGWSILSPSQLLGPLEAGAEIAIHEMPSPGLSRTMGLVWRKREMPTAMMELTSVCRAALQDECLPRLRAVATALVPHFRILSDS
ncbi:DNA-binding transcriptional regulator, LysR family [Beijerinckia sp. 28-YEA-48]|nr:DNA-binding transcriptional regulator, LysR family [Beijerinckia sp. 28-YEA-48]